MRDRALADDVAQETFVTAWRRLPELRDATRLPAWLCGIARNVARDARKRLRTRAARETHVEEDAAMRDPTTPFDELSDAETERLLATALERVPELYREPLVLYYYEERSVDDVARSLGISTATTNKRLSRGRQYLAASVAIVERELPRLGPSPALVASVLAAIGVMAAPTHVEAATVKGTSNMHKLALVAAVTASLGGAGFLLVDTQRGDAHPDASARAVSPSRR